MFGAIAVGAILAVAAAVPWLPRPSDLDRFWAPVTASEGRLLVCVGQPKVYKFERSHPGTAQSLVRGRSQIRSRPSSGAAYTEIVPVWDRFVGLGDAQAFTMISSYFAQRGRKVDLGGGRSVSLADLRGRPVVLIGGFNNEWTLSLAGELRFYFEHSAQRSSDILRDRQNPAGRDWEVDSPGPVRKPSTDYALVTRVRNATTEQTVVIAAGITDFGTRAAGEFLTTPEYFAEALRGAPPDWRRKNMQIVLSAKVLSGTVGPPRMLAVHFW